MNVERTVSAPPGRKYHVDLKTASPRWSSQGIMADEKRRHLKLVLSNQGECDRDHESLRGGRVVHSLPIRKHPRMKADET